MILTGFLVDYAEIIIHIIEKKFRFLKLIYNINQCRRGVGNGGFVDSNPPLYKIIIIENYNFF